MDLGVLSTFGSTGLILGSMLALTAMGGYLSERAGVVDIGLEGKILGAACATAIVGGRFGAVAGVAGAILVAVLLSLLHWTATQRLRIDAVVSGMAINLLASGGTLFFYDLARLWLPTIPTLGSWTYVALAVVAPAALWFVATRTRAGLRLTAVGADPDKARLMGVRPPGVRLRALLGTGVMCGLGGAAVLTFSGSFSDNMTSGRGYVALAALILGGWRPVPTALACLGFGGLSALQTTMQGRPVFGVELPSQLWSSLPYLATLVALAGFLGKSRTPAGLGKP